MSIRLVAICAATVFAAWLLSPAAAVRALHDLEGQRRLEADAAAHTSVAYAAAAPRLELPDEGVSDWTGLWHLYSTQPVVPNITFEVKGAPERKSIGIAGKNWMGTRGGYFYEVKGLSTTEPRHFVALQVQPAVQKGMWGNWSGVRGHFVDFKWLTKDTNSGWMPQLLKWSDEERAFYHEDRNRGIWLRKVESPTLQDGAGRASLS
eukprot:TRINITY_DN65478_c0_g1_i1.p1 TRINITY_DN65478_c0_g1~~TRINITY_DN65478_c0_g1_i1.p1  ORF type:complete len:206 (+),score=31.80 TRINITY_DN65478_c0_g1_i1:65-682(+)